MNPLISKEQYKFYIAILLLNGYWWLIEIEFQFCIWNLCYSDITWIFRIEKPHDNLANYFLISGNGSFKQERSDIIVLWRTELWCTLLSMFLLKIVYSSLRHAEKQLLIYYYFLFQFVPLNMGRRINVKINR